jgi:hypothetical protein
VEPIHQQRVKKQTNYSDENLYVSQFNPIHRQTDTQTETERGRTGNLITGNLIIKNNC